MTLYTSGDRTTDHEIVLAVHYFMECKYALLRKYDVEVHYCDLSDDNVKGWQEKNGDEFLIHIDTNVQDDYEEHIKTLLHELVHCTQDIRYVTDNEKRESEAYELEEIYFREFDLHNIKKLMYALK